MNTRIGTWSPMLLAYAVERTFLEITRDRGFANAQVPRPLLVLGCSSSIALLVYFQHRYAARWGIPTPWLFAKEGPLEDFTFLAALVAAGFMAVAAYRARAFTTVASRASIVGAYATCALLLFAIGMEEISWGQQLLHFGTPQLWAEINYQQETTLHNLLQQDLLTSSTRYIALLFAIVAMVLPVWRAVRNSRFIEAIAPHASLIPLAVITGYAALKAHAELIEAFIALYFLFYSYRAMRLWARAPAGGTSHDR